MELRRKLEILADAAKYDASCASSGAEKRSSLGTGGIGSTGGMGICHSYAPDGRCISLLKILLTNWCAFDCAYCVNRRSSNVPRARFTVAEIVGLTLGFYKRNYIEGLFLSSGIIRSPDYTMEQLVAVARSLLEEHSFGGYIHLKAIPDAAPELLAEAGRWADRLSLNVELPTGEGLRRLAPEKDLAGIKKAMGRIRLAGDAARDRKTRFAPAGQSTQMIIGADNASDATILRASASLYGSYRLRRVYYSAFSPIPDASRSLPLKPPPLWREHRLYQADWLMRFYGFSADEVVDGGVDGMLDLDVDPKLAWALKHRGRFPVDVNRAPREQLLRVPGLGRRSVERLLAARRHRRVRLEDLPQLGISLAKVAPFVIAEGHRPKALDRADLRARIGPAQLSLFAGA